MTTAKMQFPAKVEFAAPEEGEESQLTKFTMNAYGGSSAKLDGWPLPLVIDLDGLDIPDRDIPVLRDHDRNRIVGHGRADRSAFGVTMRGVISADEEDDSQKIVKYARNGYPWQASIGSVVTEQERIPKGRTVRVNGERFSGPIIVGRKSELDEVSFVTLGADRNTTVNVAAAAKKTGDKAMSARLEKWAEETGADLSGMNDEAREQLEAKLFASAPKKKADDGDGSDPFAPIKTAQQRRKAFEAVGAKVAGEFPTQVESIEKAVYQSLDDESMTPEKLELQLYRSANDYNVNPFRRNEKNLAPKVFEAALCQSLGIESDKYSDDINEAAHKEFHGRMGIQEFLFRAAKINSGEVFHSAKHRTDRLVEAAFNRGRKANFFTGFSTLDVGEVLANVQNKMLADYFSFFETAWRSVSRQRQVSDLKPTSTVAMTGGTTFQKVSKGGEIPHGTLGAEGYSNQAETYGIILSITEDDIINDDLGALSDLGRIIAKGAADAINRDFWAAFLDDSTFFTSGNGNLITSPLDADGLADAKAALERQTDEFDNPMGLKGAIILVPTELDVQASTLVNSQLVVGSTDRPDGNFWRGKYQPVTSQYLTDPTDWYLLANPMIVPVMEVVFFGGQSPQVDTARASVESARLGIVSRGVYRYGCRKQEHRAAVKSEVPDA